MAGVVATLWCWLGARPAQLHGDVVRDFLYARDCVSFGACTTIGAPTTVPGVSQGGFWLDVLAAALALGGGAREVQCLAAACNGLAVAIVLHALSRQGDVTRARVAALAFFVAVLGIDSVSQLWNPTLLPLLGAGACASLAIGAELRSEALLALAALCTSLAIATHPAALALLPALLVITAATSADARAALLVVLPVLALPLWLTSRDALLAAASGRGALLAGAGAGLALLTALGAALRRRAGALSPSARAERAWRVLAVSALPGLLLLLLARHTVFGYYFVPLAPALCAVLAARVVVFVDARPALVLLALGGVLASVGAHLAPRLDGRPWYRLDDTAPIAARLLPPATSWERVMLGLEGPRCHDLAHGLALHAPAGGAPGAVDPWLVLRLPASDAAAAQSLGFEWWALDRRTGVALRRSPAWVDPQPVNACRGPVGECEPLPLRAPLVPRSRPFRFASRSYPYSWPPGASDDTRLEITLAVSERPAPIALDLVDELGGPCDWRVVDVQGASWSARAAGVELAAGGAARLRLAREVRAECKRQRDELRPPCWVQHDAREDLSALVAHAQRP